MYQFPDSISKETYMRIDNAFSILNCPETTEPPRLARFVNNLRLFMGPLFDSNEFFKTVFLRPRLKKQNSYLVQISNKHTVPTVFRRFHETKFFWEDLTQLDNAFTLSRAMTLVQTLQEGIQAQRKQGQHLSIDFYLVEQSALLVELAIRFYQIGPLVGYLDSLYVLPRTPTTCYILGTTLAIQALRYAFLTEIVSPKMNRNQSSAPTKTLEEVCNRPWVFPILYRTWLEAVNVPGNHITQHPAMKSLALHQTILAMVKLCYLVANKNLFNTWMEDSWKDSEERSSWIWTNSMQRAMFPMDHPSFFPYYSRFFCLLARLWSTPLQVRSMIVEATQNLPSIDDYLAPKCSIFAFVESFVFVGASHGIRRDAIEWLYDLFDKNMNTQVDAMEIDVDGTRCFRMEIVLLPCYLLISLIITQAMFLDDHTELSDSRRVQALIRDFPNALALINILAAKNSKRVSPLPGDSWEQTQWDSMYITLSADEPDTSSIMIMYYTLCMATQWTEYEVQRLALSCRLAPNHRLTSKDTNAPSKEENEAPASLEESSMDNSVRSNLDDEADEIMKQLEGHFNCNFLKVKTRFQSLFCLEMQRRHALLCGNEEDELTESQLLDLAEQESSMDSDDFSQSFDASEPNKGSRKRARANSIQLRLNKRLKCDDALPDKFDKIPYSKLTRWSFWSQMIFNQMILKQEVFTSNNHSVSLTPPPQCQIELEFFSTLEECSKITDIHHFDYDKLPVLRNGFMDCFSKNNAFVMHLGKDNQNLNIDPSWLDSSIFAQTFSQQIHQYAYKTNQLHKDGYFNLMLKSQIRMFFDCEIFHIPSTIYQLLSPYPCQSAQRQVLESVFESSLWQMDDYKKEFLIPAQSPKLTPAELAQKFMPPPPPPPVEVKAKPRATKKKESVIKTGKNSMFFDFKL